MFVRNVVSIHGASHFFSAESSLQLDNVMEKFKPPERQLSHGKLEDEKMNLS
jgi:hypothetical protein